MLERLADTLLEAVCRAKSGGVIVNEHVLDAGELKRHIDVIGRHFEFIHHDQLLSRLRKPGRRPFCLLTFDDGKRSNATVVAPSLQDLGIPAVFYVCTEALTTGVPLWFDEYHAIIRAAGEIPSALERDKMLHLPYGELLDRLAAGRQDYGSELDASHEDVNPMTWDDARALDDAGFTVGAHGVRHATIPSLSRLEAECEIKLSMEAVSSELGVQCETFAFPNGNYTSELAQLALDVGAVTVMTTEPTWVHAASSLWRLPRVQVSRSHSKRRIAAKLSLAAAGWILKNPDGTGRAYRKFRL